MALILCPSYHFHIYIKTKFHFNLFSTFQDMARTDIHYEKWLWGDKSSIYKPSFCIWFGVTQAIHLKHNINCVFRNTELSNQIFETLLDLKLTKTRHDKNKWQNKQRCTNTVVFNTTHTPFFSNFTSSLKQTLSLSKVAIAQLGFAILGCTCNSDASLSLPAKDWERGLISPVDTYSN